MLCWCKIWERYKKRSWTENQIRLMVRKEIISMWKNIEIIPDTPFDPDVSHSILIVSKDEHLRDMMKEPDKLKHNQNEERKRTWQLHLHHHFDCCFDSLLWLFLVHFEMIVFKKHHQIDLLVMMMLFSVNYLEDDWVKERGTKLNKFFVLKEV